MMHSILDISICLELEHKPRGQIKPYILHHHSASPSARAALVRVKELQSYTVLGASIKEMLASTDSGSLISNGEECMHM